MTRPIPLFSLFLPLLLATLAHTPAAAQEPPRISALSYLDRTYMQARRDELDELARSRLGRQFRGERDADLELLQALLDRRLVQSGDTLQLQGMGIVLGDLLAQDLDMHWVVYEDQLGRSRALRYRESDNYLFPVTMISRRQEGGSNTPVTAIYDKAYNIIDPLRTPLPFQ